MKFYDINQIKNILTVNFFEFLASELSVCESGTLIPKLLLLVVGVEGVAGVAFGIFISTKKSKKMSLKRCDRFLYLTHSFPMHPFSIPWKHQKTVWFSDAFGG